MAGNISKSGRPWSGRLRWDSLSALVADEHRPRTSRGTSAMMISIGAFTPVRSIGGATGRRPDDRRGGHRGSGRHKRQLKMPGRASEPMSAGRPQHVLRRKMVPARLTDAIRPFSPPGRVTPFRRSAPTRSGLHAATRPAPVRSEPAACVLALPGFALLDLAAPGAGLLVAVLDQLLEPLEVVMHLFLDDAKEVACDVLRR